MMENSSNASCKPFDWKKISAIDANNFDPNSYSNEEILNLTGMITSCSLSEFHSPSDANLMKLFRISQTLMSFLLQGLKQVKQQQPSNASSLEKERTRLDSENKKLRKVLQLHQKTFQCSLTGAFRCSHCPKTFMDQNFLDQHVEKRHPITSLDSESGLALREKIADYNAKLGFDKKAFDEMLHELDSFKSKLEQAEATLAAEREARSLLETKIDHEISQKFRDLEESFSDHVNANQRNTLTVPITTGFVPEHDDDVRSEQKDQESRLLNSFDAVLSKHTKQVQKLGKEIEVLSHKLDNAAVVAVPLTHEATVEREPVKDGKQEAAVKQVVHKAKAKFTAPVKDRKTKVTTSKPGINDLMRRELEYLHLNADAEGIDESSLNQALRMLEQRRSPHVAHMREKIVTILEQMIATHGLQKELHESPAKAIVADEKKHNEVRPNDSHTIDTAADAPGKDSGDAVILRSPGILKNRTNLMDDNAVPSSEKRGRRISFNEDRIEISPTDSESNEEVEEVPVARPRTSRVKQRLVPGRTSDESDDDFDLSYVDISPDRSLKTTAM
jgi:hypothetical protein